MTEQYTIVGNVYVNHLPQEIRSYTNTFQIVEAGTQVIYKSQNLFDLIEQMETDSLRPILNLKACDGLRDDLNRASLILLRQNLTDLVARWNASAHTFTVDEDTLREWLTGSPPRNVEFYLWAIRFSRRV